MKFDFTLLSDVEFIKGKPGKNYKYKALIPYKLWNRFRPEEKIPTGDIKIIPFGMPGYQQYKDRIGDWSFADHNDEKRRDLYKRRHEKIHITINGKKYISYLVPFTSEFFSYWLLW